MAHEVRKVFDYFNVNGEAEEQFDHYVDNLPEGYFYNGAYLEWNVNTKVMSYPDFNKWLVANGAEEGEDVLIKVSW